ncbi:hypothetical protein ABVK25_008773 [Lepraria finkii]|uniref:Uncharacterized protein n=1 Tax=Lepraria finkii TaxID=1340010 RepID=A0ABR4AZE3_9LECA
MPTDDTDCLDPREMTEAQWRGLGFNMAGRPLLKAIRAKCLDCCGGQPSEIRLCASAQCDLWPYRMATNPFRAKPDLTEEQRQAVGERLAAARGR